MRYSKIFLATMTTKYITANLLPLLTKLQRKEDRDSDGFKLKFKLKQMTTNMEPPGCIRWFQYDPHSNKEDEITSNVKHVETL